MQRGRLVVRPKQVGKGSLVGGESRAALGRLPPSVIGCLKPTWSGQSLETDGGRLSTGEPTVSSVRRRVNLSAWL